MNIVKKLIEYTAMACRSWRQGGLGAVNRDMVSALRYHLGTDKIEEIERKLNVVYPAVSTWSVTSWIEQSTLESNPLVSVIMPTCNRGRLLQRAVESVCAQSYTHWEIVLTDDGSTDSTSMVIEQLRHKVGDQRMNAVRVARSGVCAARNNALARANGEFIVYLDDDNIMHPLWLKAVVWAFSQRPEIDVLYGGILVDDICRMNGQNVGDLPTYYLHPFDRQRLAKNNLADIGQVAHRRDLPQARFDENLEGVGDWDLLARLTREKAPLVLPVLACFYSTSAMGRLSADPAFYEDVARVREKLG